MKNWYHLPSAGATVEIYLPLSAAAENVKSFPDAGEDSHSSVRVDCACLAVPHCTVAFFLPRSMDRITTIAASRIPKCIPSGKGPSLGSGLTPSACAYLIMNLISVT